MSRADAIRRLLHPQSVAIVGASADLGKINGRPLKHLLDKGYAGRILPVNPKYPQIAQLPCYPNIASLPEAADLAIVAVPAPGVLAALEDCAAKGVGGAVVLSSGFAETGGQGVAWQAGITALARRTADAACSGQLTVMVDVPRRSSTRMSVEVPATAGCGNCSGMNSATGLAACATGLPAPVSRDRPSSLSHR